MQQNHHAISPDTGHTTSATPVPKWGPIVGVLYSLGLAFIGGSAVAAVLLGTILGSLGMSGTDIVEWIATPVGSCAYSLLSGLIAVGLIALYVIRSRSGWRSIGILPPRWKHLGIAVIGVLVYFVLYVTAVVAVKLAVPSLDLEQEQDLGIATPHGLQQLMLVFVTLVVVPPIVEEIVFRGFMYSGLRSKLPFFASAVLTSGLFALGHLQFDNDAPLLWVAAIDTFVLSMVMCFVRERTGSIVPTMIMHALKNTIAFSLLYIFVG